MVAGMVAGMVGGGTIQLTTTLAATAYLPNIAIMGSAITMAMVLHTFKFLRGRFFTLYVGRPRCFLLHLEFLALSMYRVEDSAGM